MCYFFVIFFSLALISPRVDLSLFETFGIVFPKLLSQSKLYSSSFFFRSLFLFGILHRAAGAVVHAIETRWNEQKNSSHLIFFCIFMIFFSFYKIFNANEKVMIFPSGESKKNRELIIQVNKKRNHNHNNSVPRCNSTHYRLPLHRNQTQRENYCIMINLLQLN